MHWYTPSSIADIMVNMIPIESPSKVVDFCAGEGSLLISAKKRWPNASFYAFDNNWGENIPLALETIDNLYAKSYNSLKLKKSQVINEYCVALANPPFNAKKSINIKNTILYKLLPDISIECTPEIAFTILNIEALKIGGYIAIILPSSIISAKLGEWIRSYMLKKLKVNSIIEVPRNTFKGVDVVAHIIIGQKVINKKQDGYVELYSIDENKLLLIGNAEENELLRRMDVHYLKHLYLHKKLTDKLVLRKYLKVDVRRGRGVYGKEKEKLSRNGCIPYLHTTNIKRNKIMINERSFFFNDVRLINEDILVEKGDLVVGRVGNGCIGKVALVWDSVRAMVSDCLFIIRPLDKWMSVYIYSLLTTTFVEQYLKSLAKGTGALSLNIDDIHNIPVIGLKEDTILLSKKAFMLDHFPDMYVKQIRSIIEKEFNKIMFIKE